MGFPQKSLIFLDKEVGFSSFMRVSRYPRTTMLVAEASHGHDRPRAARGTRSGGCAPETPRPWAGHGYSAARTTRSSPQRKSLRNWKYIFSVDTR
jgi:hypothetical protein